MKAFVIDDDPVLLALLGYMLNESGIDTQYCISPLPDNFIDILLQFKPDVILIDIYLKNEKGYTLANKIRSFPELKDIPLVAMSGSDLLKDKLLAFSSGFVDYINKPFTKEEVISIVKRYGYSSEIIKLCNRIKQREVRDCELYSKFDKK